MISQWHKVLVVGDFRTGKTYWCHWLLSQAQRYIAYDPAWELNVHQGVVTHDETALAEAVASHARVIYQPCDPKAEFDAFCRVATSATNAIVYVDEPALVMSSSGAIPPAFSRLYRLGHKRGLGVLLSTHRYQGDLPALTRVAHHVVAFRCSVNRDLMALREILGEAGAEWVRTAPSHAYWHRDVFVPEYPQGRPMRPVKSRAPRQKR